MYEHIRQETALGHLCYIVCPFVETSDKLVGGWVVWQSLHAWMPARHLHPADQPCAHPCRPSLQAEVKAAASELDRLVEEGVFAHQDCGLLHGQMPPDQKDAVLQQFKQGAIKVLVRWVPGHMPVLDAVMLACSAVGWALVIQASLPRLLCAARLWWRWAWMCRRQRLWSSSMQVGRNGVGGQLGRDALGLQSLLPIQSPSTRPSPRPSSLTQPHQCRAFRVRPAASAERAGGAQLTPILLLSSLFCGCRDQRAEKNEGAHPGLLQWRHAAIAVHGGCSTCRELINMKLLCHLQVLVNCNNGFAVAECDLELRGAGEVLGKRQSGKDIKTTLKASKDTATNVPLCSRHRFPGGHVQLSLCCCPPRRWPRSRRIVSCWSRPGRPPLICCSGSLTRKSGLTSCGLR